MKNFHNNYLLNYHYKNNTMNKTDQNYKNSKQNLYITNISYLTNLRKKVRCISNILKDLNYYRLHNLIKSITLIIKFNFINITKDLNLNNEYILLFGNFLNNLNKMLN